MKDMWRRILAGAAVMTAAGSMLFAEGGYAALLAKAKGYEAKKQYVHALGTYWDAMEAAPEKAGEALEAYEKLGSVIRAGKPGYGEFDDFDLLDGWIDMYADWEAYWTENSRYVFSVSELTKGELDVATRTATYNTRVEAEKSKKYNEIKYIVQRGNDQSRRSEWKEVPYDFDDAIQSKVPSEADHAVQLGIADKDGKILVTGTPVTLRSYDTDYAFAGVDRATIKVLDAGGVKIVPVAVSCRGAALALDFVKWTVSGTMDTNLYATDGVSLAKACSDCVKVGGIYMMKTELTQSQYRAVTGKNPSNYKGSNRPVECMSWYAAIRFCNKLSEMKGLTPCYSVKGSTNVDTWTDYSADDVEWNKAANGWRLPTEEEWAKAADDGHKYSGSNNLDEVAWYSDNSDSETHDVAGKKANAKGLYDMSGNVWEWCWDRYSGSSSSRVSRGGSYYDGSGRCAVSFRYGNGPGSRDFDLGFRVVRNAD